ncbi:hypothetical protein DERP_005198 [Dermatophagoides pteronyssinus]|uniref:Uncharacterized protein n=1 Tax=Dermatophagoides pteronyssinus TaxID=6956 RepID=A0ABQ8JMI2_DERPT|nr:hypothetical protein DERP_005198 [Dermatophagoides pteronyssinus]
MNIMYHIQFHNDNFDNHLIVDKVDNNLMMIVYDYNMIEIMLIVHNKIDEYCQQISLLLFVHVHQNYDHPKNYKNSFIKLTKNYIKIGRKFFDLI